MSRTLKALLVFLVVLLLVALGGVVGYFLVKNSHWVVIRFPVLALSWDDPFPVEEYDTPLPLVMAVSFAAGLVLGLMVFVPSWLRRAVERRRERRFIRGLEGELSDLRNLPVTDPAPLEDIADEPDGEGGGRRERAREQDEDEALLAAALREADRPGGAS